MRCPGVGLRQTPWGTRYANVITGCARCGLRHQLSGWGLRCVDVACAADALDLLDRGDHFDLALIDMNMPDITGADLADTLRRNPHTRAMALILASSITWRPDPGQRELFDATLTKPVRASTLHTILSRLLTGHPPVAATAATTTTRPWHQPLRMLLAEDNHVNQLVAQTMLAKLGHRVDTVANGHEAVQALHRAPYDVVLMDVHLPVLDRLQATRQIRSQLPPQRQPHIIAMTASVLAEDRTACELAGMNDYLPKPVGIPELTVALTPILQPVDTTDTTDFAPVPAGTPPFANAPTSVGNRHADILARLYDISGPDLGDAERALLTRLLRSFTTKTPDALTALTEVLQAC